MGLSKKKRRRNYAKRDWSIDKYCSATRKVRYGSLAEADKAAGEVLDSMGRKLWAYRCSICKRWHLTKKSPDSWY